MTTSTLPLSIVTGAGGGIGSAIVRALRHAGHRVIAVDRDAELLASTFADDSMVVATGLDVTDSAAVESLIGNVAREHGAIHSLVNAAGIYLDGALELMSEADVDLIFAVNVKGTLFPCQAVAAHMKEQGRGCIINVSSIAADLSSPSNGLYGATKGAVNSLTRGLAISLAPSGIRVNAIAPGPVATPMADAALRDPEYARMMLSRIALHRLGQPHDVASAVAFLVSDAANWITGSILTVDGGVRALR